METGRTLALDIGSKRTGVALSDEMGIIASPLTVVEANNLKEWLRGILSLIEEYEVVRVVVGLPLNQYGEEGQDARNIRKYIALLQEATSVPVVEWDERFTTAQAERLLLEADLSRKRRKQVIDKVAATIILQSYLDSRDSLTGPMDAAELP